MCVDEMGWGILELNFAGIFCFGSSLLTDCKIEVGIFMIDWLFYQQYHCDCQPGTTRHPIIVDKPEPARH